MPGLIIPQNPARGNCFLLHPLRTAAPTDSPSAREKRDLCKITVDISAAASYNATNQAKPMSKRSTWSGHLSESRGWWDHGRELSSEWTCEGSANGESSVAADGARTRYPGGAYGSTRDERAQCVNLGGTAGWFQVLSQIWDRAFFDSILNFSGKERRPMKLLTKRWRGLCRDQMIPTRPLSEIFDDRMEKI